MLGKNFCWQNNGFKLLYGCMKINIRKINQELKRLGWSHSEYARRMNVTRQAANHYLNHEINSMKIVERMALPLNLDPKDLLK